MEKYYLHPEEVRSKFRSKADLYRRISIDLDIYLPSYSRCSLEFMKKVLAGEKKYLKNKEVIHFEVPKYPELGVKAVWPLIQESQDLVQYFPDYKPSQLPEKDFMYGILSSVMPDEVRVLISECVEKRSLSMTDDKDDMIQITPELKDGLERMFLVKTTKGRANFLLKKGSAFPKERKPAKKFIVDTSMIKNYKQRAEPEESKENKGQNDDLEF